MREPSVFLMNSGYGSYQRPSPITPAGEYFRASSNILSVFSVFIVSSTSITFSTSYGLMLQDPRRLFLYCPMRYRCTALSHTIFRFTSSSNCPIVRSMTSAESGQTPSGWG